MSIILFSSKITASQNIACELAKLGFESTRDVKIIDTRVKKMLDIPVHFDTDFYIVASPHKSKMKLQSLTVHIPGNWDNADFGGKPRTLNYSFPSMQKKLLAKMYEKNKKYGLFFNVSYEVDHHGPTIDKPIIFVEIGSTVNEWKNPIAAKIIAESIVDALDDRESFENYFGIGGGHYAPTFTCYALEKNIAFGHMLPKYAIDSISKDTFKQALEKNAEKVEKIMFDKKGVNGTQRKKIEALANEFGIEIKNAKGEI